MLIYFKQQVLMFTANKIILNSLSCQTDLDSSHWECHDFESLNKLRNVPDHWANHMKMYIFPWLKILSWLPVINWPCQPQGIDHFILKLILTTRRTLLTFLSSQHLQNYLFRTIYLMMILTCFRIIVSLSIYCVLI